MINYRNLFSKKETPQTEPLPGMAANNAGGFAFPVDDWKRLDRFLILGSEGGTYYVKEQPLTRENAKAAERCIAEDGPRVVRRIAEISDQGRAPKNDPALFILAMCAAADPATREAAFAALPKTARIGTHLFHFAEFIEGFRGWGRGLRRAIARWYGEQSTAHLALQAVKYQQRDGWSHRDLLRLAHPKAAKDDAPRRALYDWICRGSQLEGLPELVQGFIKVQAATSAAETAALIRQYRLPRETMPTEMLNYPAVWEALLVDMPMTALIRNLAKMSAIGLLAPLGEAVNPVVQRLNDPEAIRQSRLHPLAILLALATYKQGKGERGKLTWAPVTEIVDALDAAFYLAFQHVEPANKRLLLALDISGSMFGSKIAGGPLDAATASAAMALITAKTEPRYHAMAFADSRSKIHAMVSGVSLEDIALSSRQRLDDVLALMQKLSQYMSGTDCAQPMLTALERKLPVDAFIIYTDSETWAGKIHPVEALAKYRQKMGIPAKLIVVGMSSNGFSIADPNDAGMLDVVGFDTAAPAVMSDFIRE